MTLLDWILVVGINGTIVLYGLRMAKSTRSSVDWFLAARGLPWWIVGLSMFATAVDSGDYVAVVGGAYTVGLSYLTTWWLGMSLGWLLVAYVVVIPIYRTGMFTNAEYLEHRFGPSVRILSALIQLQYRTNVIGNTAFSLYLIFSILTDWGSQSWWLVAAIALAAAVYTAMGGLKSVAMTDAIQSVVMAVAALVLWVVVWNAVGGWSGLEARLDASDPALVEKMLHVGGQNTQGVPAVLMIFGWIVALAAYCVVNQTQAMRMLAARSEWDLKTAVLLASLVTAIVMWFNVSLGVMGRGLMPDIAIADELYPLLIRQYLGAGLTGLVVAGVLAGGISTFDSIGSALSAVLTRDIYARFLVKSRDDSHYLQVSRWLSGAVIAVSFLYIPFLKSGMMIFYMRLTSVAVMPLFTVYIMGTLSRVHRRSGMVGLMAGILFGVISFVGDRYQWPLPFWWTNQWWAYPLSMTITAFAMLAATMIWGWESKEEIGSLLYSKTQDENEFHQRHSKPKSAANWLEATQLEVMELHRYGGMTSEERRPWFRRPFFWICVLIGILGYLSLVVLW